MIDHYDAFISYKHAPDDIRVAEAVQRGLEHFRIPGKIRKKTGKKRIERIFRDKDELPITSSLGETISYALDHSDYLIVICSTRTKESEWVQREIDYFLQSHSKRQVLTVLVDGEPQDVVPKVLQEEEYYITTSEGRVETFKRPLEPLSCDYRMSKRKAKKVELPRLASALIGCSYDELMNRRRHYAIRRTIFAFALFALTAAGATIYLLQSRENLRKNYMNSLRNQSKYLANESRNLLENEQRITAIQLALEALPKDDKDERPVTPEAIRALTEATRAYVTDSSSRVGAEWNYRSTGVITDFQLSPSGNYLAVYDSSDIVTAWDTRTHERTLWITREFVSIDGILFTDNDSLLVWNENRIALYSVSTGKANWNMYLGDYTSLKDAKDAMQLIGNYIYTCTNDSEIIRVDLKTGEKTVILKLPGEADGETLFIYKVRVSSDEKRVLFYGSIGTGSDYVAGIASVDEPEKTRISAVIGEGNSYVVDIEWADNNTALIAVGQDMMSSSLGTSQYTILTETKDKIYCMDATSLKQRWVYDFTFDDVSLTSGFMLLPQSNSVAFCAGNKMDIMDLKTGECLHSYNLNRSIVDFGDANGDGVPNFVTTNGGLGFPVSNSETDKLTMYYYFCDDLSAAEISNGIYVQQDDAREVIFYGLHVSDKEWKEIDPNTVISSLDSGSYSANALALLRSEMNPKTEENLYIVSVYDLRDFTTVHNVGLEAGDDTVTFHLIGVDEDTVYLYRAAVDGEIKLVRVNISSGKAEEGETLRGEFEPVMHFAEGKIYYVLNGQMYTDDPAQLVVYDPKTKQERVYDLDEEHVNDYSLQVFPFPEHNAAFIGGLKNTLLDLETGEELAASFGRLQGWQTLKDVKVDSKGENYIVSDGKYAAVFNSDMTLKYQLADMGVGISGIDFYEEKNGETILLVLYDTGYFCRYALEDGAFLGASDITVKVGANDFAEFELDKENHTMYIRNELDLNVVDTDTWVETAYIRDCLMHHMDSDRFITCESMKMEEIRIGYFEHYTMEDLIRKGKEVLQGLELSDEQKSNYGISTEED